MATVDVSVAQAASIGETLAECLGIRFGEISFTIRNGKVTHLTKRETLHVIDDDRQDSAGIG